MTDAPGPTGKGRPTPKRSDSRRRTGPVAPPPATRKEAAKRLRDQQAEQRKRVREGTAAGDERVLLRRDAGPVRRAVRDVVDSRRNLGIVLLPVALLYVVANLAVGQLGLPAAVSRGAFGIWVATLLAVVLDTVLAALQISTLLRQRFPDEKGRLGHIAYGLLRTTVLRRFRTPPPQVPVGGRR